MASTQGGMPSGPTDLVYGARVKGMTVREYHAYLIAARFRTFEQVLAAPPGGSSDRNALLHRTEAALVELCDPWNHDSGIRRLDRARAFAGFTAAEQAAAEAYGRPVAQERAA